MLPGNRFSSEVEPSTTIEEIKSRIEGKQGIPPEQQQLWYANKILENEKSLSDYNIEHRSVLHLITKSSGSHGSDIGVRFVDVSDETGSRRVELGTTDDELAWRRATGGLCLEGICTNHRCKIERHRVIIPIGYKKFDLVLDSNESSTKCPMCSRYVESTACTFNNCWWRWAGVKQDTVTNAFTQCSGDWKYADNAHHYFGEGDSGTIAWRQLILEAVEHEPTH